ncbi:MAG TPA: phospholipid carrier-dependent glycosyltransferase [Anaeromyxobacteraceae bacterium]|nr:phospholipid carrier-dependent glycosyltransferase [Anaeromyxobacteraceae bacterium]
MENAPLPSARADSPPRRAAGGESAPASAGARTWPDLVLAACVATFSYLYGLGSIFAPAIGDEPLYLQIARMTARSGRLLPLLAESGINDTKPPLLFWQGILASGFGASWELWRLRLPVVALSFCTAALAGLTAARISRRTSAAPVAALAFLGFLSTIQHGRPFLTNAGETLFLFLPLAIVAMRDRTGPALGALCGLSLGAATLYKSFFMVVPGTFALALVLWQREGRDLRSFLRRRGAFLAVAATVGLAVFGLWPALDPRRDVIWSQFVVGENAGKFQVSTFLSGLVRGDYPIWEIWLGDLKNAGLYAPLVLALVWDLWKRRRSIPAPEAELWMYLLAFLLVYSLPTQRQANYILPTTAALAVLLALRWDELPAIVFRLTLGALALAGTLLPLFERVVERRLETRLFGPAAVALPLAVAALALAGALSRRFARRVFPYAALLTLAAGSSFLAPFSRPFPESALAEVRGRPVLMPNTFQESQERFRFLVPGAEVRPYPCMMAPAPCGAPAPRSGAYAAIYRDPGEPLPPGYEAVAALPHLKGRHSAQQIREMLGGRLDLLVQWFVLARPASASP